eukprot:TRINITY_DN36788_c0_g1_i1.p1 TRINITY_DN36788_c0_g1~~TRINITY_DN36788_c0_g1_i1.p1  ORF type:complete len:130 (-),score=23.52 TRINITY_DN36788_c0_g1_i1:51-440(-)
MGEYGVARHEELGALFAERACGLSLRIGNLIRGHVSAKRYLVATDPSYYGKLSDASKQTLLYQGGPMTPGEVEAYKQQNNLKLDLTMRHFDECAKLEDLASEKPLEYYLKLVDDFLDEQQQQQQQQEQK